MARQAPPPTKPKKTWKGDKKLSPGHEAFVREYLVDLNGTAAAKRAGYSEKTAHVIAHQLLKIPLVRLAIQEGMDSRAKRIEITADRVLQELAKLAFVNTQDLYDDIGNLIPVQDLPRETAAAIHSIKVISTAGSSALQEIKLHDKKTSLELLGKHLVLFTDKKEVTGPNGEPLFPQGTNADEIAKQNRERMLAELAQEESK